MRPFTSSDEERKSRFTAISTKRKESKKGLYCHKKDGRGLSAKKTYFFVRPHHHERERSMFRMYSVAPFFCRVSAVIPLPPFPFKSTPWSEKKKRKKASFSLSWASLLLMEGGKKGLTLYPPFPLPRPTDRRRNQPTKKWKGKVRGGVPASVRDVLLTLMPFAHSFLPSSSLFLFSNSPKNKLINLS